MKEEQFRAGNTTMDTNCIVQVEDVKVIKCDDFCNIQLQLPTFRYGANNLIKKTVVRNRLNDNKINLHAVEALAACHEKSFQNVSGEVCYLAKYHLLLLDQLNNPASWAMYPTIDALSFTLEASKEELKLLMKFFDEGNISDKFDIERYIKREKRNKNTTPGVSEFGKCYREEYKERNLYLKTVKAQLKNENCGELYISMGLKGDPENNKMRPVRFSLNPARFSKVQLRNLFHSIREARIFQDFDAVLKNANITRIDIAIDFIGIPTPVIIANVNQAMHYTYYPKPDSSEKLLKSFVETINIGHSSDSHLQVYSKTDKVISKKQRHVLSILGPDAKLISISRCERVYKPQHNGGRLKLGSLTNAAFFLKGVKFYSPFALSQIAQESERQLALTRGYLPSQMELNSNWSVLQGYFDAKDLKLKSRRNFNYAGIVKESQKTQKLRLARRKTLEELKKHEIPFNEKWFKEMQVKMLTRVYKLIFNL